VPYDYYYVVSKYPLARALSRWPSSTTAGVGTSATFSGRATTFRTGAGFGNTSAALLLVFGIKIIVGTGLSVPRLSQRRSASGVDGVSRYATPWRDSAGSGNTSVTLLLMFRIEIITGTGL
jgi:hypothetical protein